MKFKLGGLCIVFAIFCSLSCKEDCYYDCLATPPSIFMKIASKVDSTDLLFGENKVYNIADFKAFSFGEVGLNVMGLSASDSLKYTLQYFYTLPDLEQGSSVDSFLTIDKIDFNTSRMFIDYGNSDVDTLDLTFQNHETECCGIGSVVMTIIHNGIPVFNKQEGDFFTILKK